jgi:hypothetical protein
MTTTTRRRVDWTVARWADFGRRCQAVRDRLAALPYAVEGLAGVRARHLDALLRAGTRLFSAMTGAETVFEVQHPGQGYRAIAIIHGGDRPRAADRLSPHLRSHTARAILSREQWTELGREVKSIEEALSALMMEFQGTYQARKAPHVNRFFGTLGAFCRAKCLLDDLVCEQHRDWSDAIHVFYGSTDPSLN